MGVGGWGRLEVKIIGGEQARVLEESPTRKLKSPRIVRRGVLESMTLSLKDKGAPISEQGQGRAQTKGLGYRGCCAWLVNRAMGGCGWGVREWGRGTDTGIYGAIWDKGWPERLNLTYRGRSIMRLVLGSIVAGSGRK